MSITTMPAPYQVVPRFYIERITIAALCNETMNLHWQDDQTGMNYMATVWPLEIIERNMAEYLLARNQDGEILHIRLDLIRNFPTPVK